MRRLSLGVEEEVRLGGLQLVRWGRGVLRSKTRMGRHQETLSVGTEESR